MPTTSTTPRASWCNTSCICFLVDSERGHDPRREDAEGPRAEWQRNVYHFHEHEHEGEAAEHARRDDDARSPVAPDVHERREEERGREEKAEILDPRHVEDRERDAA